MSSELGGGKSVLRKLSTPAECQYFSVLNIRIRKILASWIRIRKTGGSTDPDPRGKISTKTGGKKNYTLKTQIFEERWIVKTS